VSHSKILDLEDLQKLREKRLTVMASTTTSKKTFE